MPKPNDFISSTDYPTLKNQNRGTATFNLAGGITIAGSGSYEIHADGAVGTIGSLARGTISSSFNSGLKFVGNSILFNRTGTVSGSSAPYQVLALTYRVSPTLLRFQVFISNPYSSTLTTQAGVDTIIIYSNAFIAPYA